MLACLIRGGGREGRAAYRTRKTSKIVHDFERRQSDSDFNPLKGLDSRNLDSVALNLDFVALGLDFLASDLDFGALDLDSVPRERARVRAPNPSARQDR